MQRSFLKGLLAAGLINLLASTATLAAPLGAAAEVSSKGFIEVRRVPLAGPPGDYNPEQLFNFEIGQIAAYLKACGYFPLSQEPSGFKTDADAFQRSYGTLAGADSVSGGCSQLKNSVEEWIEEQRSSRG
jgi:hypothetical protein